MKSMFTPKDKSKRSYEQLNFLQFFVFHLEKFYMCTPEEDLYAV